MRTTTGIYALWTNYLYRLGARHFICRAYSLFARAPVVVMAAATFFSVSTNAALIIDPPGAAFAPFEDNISGDTISINRFILGGIPDPLVVTVSATGDPTNLNIEPPDADSGIGEQNFGSGTLIIDGATMTSQSGLVVGDLNSTGLLQVINGGAVEFTEPGKGITIGRGSNGVGEVQVESLTVPSTLTTTQGPIDVGSSGSGTLTIGRRGIVTANIDGVTIGNGGVGMATVAGAGAVLESNGPLTVGGAGTGTLIIDNLGRVLVNAADATVGGGANPGLVTVGAGTGDPAATELRLDSFQKLTIAVNGTVNGVGTITGPVELNGGTLDPGLSPGTLTIDGLLTVISGTIRIEIENGSADKLIFDGALDLTNPNLIILLVFVDTPDPAVPIDLEDYLKQPNGDPTVVIGSDLDLTARLSVTGLGSQDTVQVGVGSSIPPVLISGPQPVRNFSGQLPGGGATDLGFTTADTDCTFDSDPLFVAATNPPVGITFPYGVAAFTVSGCADAGATITVNWDLGEQIPPNAIAYKTDPYRELTGATINGSVVTYSITDGGLFDADGEVNGVIVDPVGVGIPVSPPPEPAPIPALSLWALWVLGGLIGLFGAWRVRRH